MSQTEAARPCARDGCSEPGLHRAPLSRDDLDRYQWLCLDHVREFNRAWNYCAGRNEKEIERLIREDIVGWRPTWPMGQLVGGFGRFDADAIRRNFRYDPLGGFGDADDAAQRKRDERKSHSKRRETNGSGVHHAVGDALNLLGLTPPITATALKTRYKILAKKFHPDTNGGDKASEEQLKLINQAYATLKSHFGA